ncbi:MAG: hypothetical protein A3H42_00655 [Deltaproteobacteria bacterium RIFCSPLOWO2_02_FULL_46_8]|nr:MAG: hypothetical protein A3H42_00655 [Deltaproteobacteria bacterium RIFCSPLOWO2_02_FULL_46_8]
MPVNPDFKDLLHLLNSGQVKYLVVGAYAVMHYTEPRYTKDVDFWVAADSENAQKVYNALKKFGAPVHNASPEDFTNSELVYQIGVEPNRIDVLMGIEGVDFQKAWKNKTVGTYGGEKFYLLGIKDLIRTKKIANRPQDKLDLEVLKLVLKKKKAK